MARAGAATGPSRAATCSPRSGDRKSTRLNSSHANISYAVFCLKKKTTIRCALAFHSVILRNPPAPSEFAFQPMVLAHDLTALTLLPPYPPTPFIHLADLLYFHP